jgi:rod shape-determining protein MreC
MQERARRTRTILLLAAVAGGLLLISRTGIGNALTTVLVEPLRPLAGLFSGGTAAAETAVQGEELTPQEQRERIQELESALASLQVEMVHLREIEQDYHRLSELLDYATGHEDQELVTADVIARDTSGYLRWIIINRGARAGIQSGDPVISASGLVGRVEDVSADASWVRLVNDQSSAINGWLQNARAEGTVMGQLRGSLRMSFIPQEAVVEPGDLVLTSGLGGNFPAGIVIGQVTSVRQQEAELFQQAEVRPMVDFDHLELASVIISFEPVDISVFEEQLQEQPEVEGP